MAPLLILAHVEMASRLTALLNGQFTPTAIAAGVTVAFGFGAVHALSPGHGISGGLVPCPSALVLLLSAISLHHITHGLVLIGGFSLGLTSWGAARGSAGVVSGVNEIEKPGCVCTPRLRKSKTWLSGLHQANLRQDALPGQKLSGNSDHKTQHGQATVPGFCKVNKPKLTFAVFHDR
jgi:hypothetical protein